MKNLKLIKQLALASILSSICFLSLPVWSQDEDNTKNPENNTEDYHKSSYYNNNGRSYPIKEECTAEVIEKFKEKRKALGTDEVFMNVDLKDVDCFCASEHGITCGPRYKD